MPPQRLPSAPQQRPRSRGWPGAAQAATDEDESQAAAPATWSEESDFSEEETQRAIAPLPCCRNWALCASVGRCEVDASVLRQIHDEDEATVHIVRSRQFEHLVVYKRYERTAGSSTLTAAVQDELALYRQFAGRGHTIPLLDSFLDQFGDPVLVFPLCDDDTPSAPSHVREYARQLLESLAFLAERTTLPPAAFFVIRAMRLTPPLPLRQSQSCTAT